MTSINYSLKGYSALTDTQKRIISTLQKLESAYSQEYRSEDSAISCARNTINCHLSALMVELEKPTWSMTNEDIPISFFDAKYSKKRISTSDQLINFISKCKFPSIVHVSQENKSPKSHHPVMHTFLGLELSNRTLICWEKVAYIEEFRFSTHLDILSDYQDLYWGYRPLKVHKKHWISSMFKSF